MAELDTIYNFAKVSEQLGTAGQPKAEQFPMIKEAGYQVIINLASGKTEEDVQEEPEIVADLGLDYHHLPIDWEQPTSDDIEKFFALMNANKDKQVFVHCIANYRVSGFVMLHRVIQQDVPLADAKAFKDTVWNPEHVFPVWDEFITTTLKRYGIEETH